MDAIKFAFETTLVGLLALPWLALLLNFFLTKSQISQLAETHVLFKLRDSTVMSIMIITVSYFMGSAILPIATQLLDDQDTPIRKIREIRADMNKKHLGWFDAKSTPKGPATPLSSAVTRFLDTCNPEDLTDGTGWRPTDDMLACWRSANDLFSLQQQLVLGVGAGQIDRVGRLYEQVIVLRGAVLNSFLFVSLSWFAYFSSTTPRSVRALTAFAMKSFGARPPHRPVWPSRLELLQFAMGFALAGALIFLAFKLGWSDITTHDVTDPPIMESVLLALGLIGLWGLVRGVEGGSYPVVTLILAFALMLLAFGAWQWTEVLYTDSVIAAFFAKG